MAWRVTCGGSDPCLETSTCPLDTLQLELLSVLSTAKHYELSFTLYAYGKSRISVIIGLNGAGRSITFGQLANLSGAERVTVWLDGAPSDRRHYRRAPHKGQSDEGVGRVEWGIEKSPKVDDGTVH